MKNYLKKDQINRKLFVKYEGLFKVLKSISDNDFLPLNQRLWARAILKNIGISCSLMKVHNRCSVTLKSRKVISGYKVNDLVLRNRMRSGFIPGFSKSSEK